MEINKIAVMKHNTPILILMTLMSPIPGTLLRNIIHLLQQNLLTTEERCKLAPVL